MINSNIIKYYNAQLTPPINQALLVKYNNLDNNQHILYELPNGLFMVYTLNYSILNSVIKFIGFELSESDLGKLVRLGEYYCVDFVKVKTIKVA